jgi:hypothetical protein
MLKDAEYEEVQGAARSNGMSIGEWVKQAIDLARRRESSVEIARKLQVIRAAARHSYPIPPEN